MDELSRNDFLRTSGPGKDARGTTQYKFTKSVALGQTRIHTKQLFTRQREADCLSLSLAVWLVLQLALRKRMKFQNTKLDTK